MTDSWYTAFFLMVFAVFVAGMVTLGACAGRPKTTVTIIDCRADTQQERCR